MGLIYLGFTTLLLSARIGDGTIQQHLLYPIAYKIWIIDSLPLPLLAPSTN